MKHGLSKIIGGVIAGQDAQSIRVRFVVGKSLAFDPTSLREDFAKIVFEAVGKRIEGSVDTPTDTGSVVKFIPRDNKDQERIMIALNEAFKKADGYQVAYDGEEPSDASEKVTIPTYSVTLTKQLG